MWTWLLCVSFGVSMRRYFHFLCICWLLLATKPNKISCRTLATQTGFLFCFLFLFFFFFGAQNAKSNDDENLFYFISFCFRQICHQSKSPCNRCNEINSQCVTSKMKSSCRESSLPGNSVWRKHWTQHFFGMVFVQNLSRRAQLVFMMEQQHQIIGKTFTEFVTKRLHDRQICRAPCMCVCCRAFGSEFNAFKSAGCRAFNLIIDTKRAQNHISLWISFYITAQFFLLPCTLTACAACVCVPLSVHARMYSWRCTAITWIK